MGIDLISGKGRPAQTLTGGGGGGGGNRGGGGGGFSDVGFNLNLDLGKDGSGAGGAHVVHNHYYALGGNRGRRRK